MAFHLVLFLMSAALLAFFLGVRLNLSPSVPLGLYRVVPMTLPLTYGQLVIIPVPESIQMFRSTWAPLLKPVAGLPGDILTVRDGRFFINETDYGPVYAHAAGKPLPRVPRSSVVPPGHVCLASHAPRSIDCRYFGTLRISRITSRAVPLWTWGD